jgi:hypothetical protein
VLDLFGFTNGGGHEGAIGFRVPRMQIPALAEYVARLVKGINEATGLD